MKSRALIIILCILLISSLACCTSQSEVQLTDFPLDSLPMYEGYKVIEYEYDDDGKDIELKYGVQDTPKDVYAYYKSYFIENNIEVAEREKPNGYVLLGQINNYIFEIEIEKPKDTEKNKYGTVVEIELDYTGKSLSTDTPTEENSTPTAQDTSPQPTADTTIESDHYLLTGKELVLEKAYSGDNEYISAYSYSNLGVTLFKVIADDTDFMLVGRTDATRGEIQRKYKGHFDGDLGQDAFGDVFVAKLDASLNIIWIQYLSYENIDPETPSEDAPMSFEKLSDGKYKISTITTKGRVAGPNNQWDYGDTVEMVYIINDSGDIVSSQEVPYHFSMQGLLASYEKKDDKLVWSITDMMDFESSNKYVVRSFDTPTGKLLYLFTYSEMSITSELSGFHSLDIAKYDELYDALYQTKGLWDAEEGKEFQISNMRDGLILKLDTEGTMQWYRYCGGSGDDTIYGGCYKDGNYYFKGYTASLDGDIEGYDPVVEEIIASTDIIEYRPVPAEWYFVLDDNGELVSSSLHESDFDLKYKDKVAILSNGNVAVIYDKNTIHIYK